MQHLIKNNRKREVATRTLVKRTAQCASVLSRLGEPVTAAGAGEIVGHGRPRLITN